MKPLNNVFSNVARGIRANQSTILTAIGTVGIIGTCVLTATATPKALKLLKKATDEKGEELTNVEKVKTMAPAYIPAAVACASTIACFLGANVLNKRKQASLTSAYALLQQSYQKYRNAAKTVYGEDADKKIQAAVAKEQYISCDGASIFNPGDSTEEKLFYDSLSERYFTSSTSSVINALYHVNRNLQLRGDVSLDEYHDFLGIERMSCGDELGWRMDDIMESGLMWLDFDIRKVAMDDGMECFTIYSSFEPSLLEPE